MELTLTKQEAGALLKFLDAARTYCKERMTNIVIAFDKREKEILMDVLEAHLETLADRINDGELEYKEELFIVKDMLNKVQEA